MASDTVRDPWGNVETPVTQPGVTATTKALLAQAGLEPDVEPYTVELSGTSRRLLGEHQPRKRQPKVEPVRNVKAERAKKDSEKESHRRDRERTAELIKGE